MASIFTVSMVNQSITGDNALVLLHTPADETIRGSIVQLIRLSVGQAGSDVSEQLGIVIGQKAAPFGSYTPATPAPHNLGGPPSGIVGGTSGVAGTAGVNASSEGSGLLTVTVADTFSNQAGYRWTPGHEERIWVAVDTALIVKLVGTPTSLDGWWASLTFEEIT